jgi:carboxypeptidase C (cathepsin A)
MASDGVEKMKRILGHSVLNVLLVFCFYLPAVQAQDKDKETKPAESKTGSESVPKEESSVTEHSIRVGNQTIPYHATSGTILLRDDNGQPNASVFYISYVKDEVKDNSLRPIAFLYNGGPGSSSVWMHMGAFGPRRVVTTDAQLTPPPPYRISENPNTLLDCADLVFIDPVGTGFSHAEGKAKDKDFWGIDQDAKSLSQFIGIYVSRNNRWNSPKFLIGESYGTFRSAALANRIQSQDGMYFNGIVMVSTVLNLGTISFNPGEDMPYIFYLPSYSATAWYHNVLKDRPADVNAFLVEARRFASTEYAAALMKGGKITQPEKSEIIRKLARFTGLSEDYLNKANLRVSLPQFMEELQRSKGLTTGRLDARFTGPTGDLLSEYADYDPQEVSVSGAFTAAFNNYVRQELNFGQDKRYEILNPQAGRNWDWKHDDAHQNFGFPGSPNVEGDLVQALMTNPHLQVQVENGIYDLATPFFATEYTMDHLALPEKLAGRIHMEYYNAGHMMYLHDEDLTKLKNNIARFITSASNP